MRLEEAIKQKFFTDEFTKAVVNVAYTQSWLYSGQQRFFKSFELTPEQYNVLRILRGRAPEASSVSLIQDRMLNKASNASRLVDKLKLKGLVDRSENELDRRQVDIKITEKGKTLLSKIDPLLAEFNKSKIGLPEPEARFLNQLLDKLRSIEP
jgi:DNA-binding MarR family transcriptional regulator